MIWLTTQKAAELLQVHISTIRRNIKKYLTRNVAGVGGSSGMQYEIALESLPQEARDRYYGQQKEHGYSVLLTLTETQRADVGRKQTIVQSYWDFKAMYPKANKLEAFLQQYNENNPKKTITKRQLTFWASSYKREGVAGLVDSRGGHNKGLSYIPEDVRKVFLALWLQEKGTRDGGPSVALCYRLTKHHFPDRELPCVRTFQRLASNVPYPAKVLHRQGEKAFDDLCMPYLSFDYRSINTNRQWVADNHLFDVLVRFPNGNIGRPWLIGWMDRRSRQIVGHLVVEHAPNADTILDAFARAVHGYGIPESVLLDNGKDYTVHDLFNPEVAYSLANEMNITVTKATPYNAKAKPIERFFRTLEESYCISLDSYVGSTPKKRPKSIENKAIPYDEFLNFIDDSIDIYNNTPHSGDGMDNKAPWQVYKENAKSIQTASPELLSLYFKRTARPVVVRRKGIKVPELQQHYDAEKLFAYQGKKVYVRYNTDDVSKVYCFDESMEFICIAVSEELASLDQTITAQNLRELNTKKKQRRKIAKTYRPDIETASIAELAEELAIKQDASSGTPKQKELPTTQTISLEHYKKSKEVKEAEKTQKAKENNQKAMQLTRRSKMEAYANYLSGG